MNYTSLWRSLTPLYDADEAKAIVRLTLETLFDMTLTDIVCGSIDNLDDASAERLQQAMHRLQHSEPVQYVLGSATFCGRSFAVKPGVLIPRPETEWLCQRINDIAQHRSPDTLSILDIGTGSGCIAISTALDNSAAHVEAWDISEVALSIARANASALGAEVKFRHTDALHAPHEASIRDIIVSNPPYICRSESTTMQPNVLLHEPETALFVPDDDPLLFYRAIALYAHEALRHGGTLLFECNTQYANATAHLLSTMGYATAHVYTDCFGKPRFVQAER